MYTNQDMSERNAAFEGKYFMLLLVEMAILRERHELGLENEGAAISLRKRPKSRH